jgi:hypothetical protein
MNQKIKIIEREIEKFGKKNDELTCLQRVGKIAELIDELKKIITNKGKI